MITIKAIKDAWHVLRNHDEYVICVNSHEDLMTQAYINWKDNGFLPKNVPVDKMYIPWREVYAYAERKGYPTTNKTTD